MKKVYAPRLIISAIVLIAVALGVWGFYPLKISDLQFSPLMGRLLFDFSLVACAIFAGIIVITLLFGRFYCSLVCPFGILQEFMALLFRKNNSFQKNLPVKYFISALVFGVLIGGSALLLRYIDPYTVFGGAVSLNIFKILFCVLVFVLVFFKNRYFCTNICPVGAILGLLSKFSLNKIYIDENKCVSCGLCARLCPSGCIVLKIIRLTTKLA